MKENSNPDIKIFLIGNKVDLEEEREISKEEAEKIKQEYDFDLFMEASAKSGFNTKEIFIEAAKYLQQIYKRAKVQDKVPMAKRLKLDKNENEEKNNNNKKKKKCC